MKKKSKGNHNSASEQRRPLHLSLGRLSGAGQKILGIVLGIAPIDPHAPSGRAATIDATLRRRRNRDDKKKKQKGTVWNISEEKLKPFVWNVGPAVRHATDDGRVRGASKVEQTADEPESLIEKERQKTSPDRHSGGLHNKRG